MSNDDAKEDLINIIEGTMTYGVPKRTLVELKNSKISRGISFNLRPSNQLTISISAGS